jgi:HlyD family secretion protein
MKRAGLLFLIIAVLGVVAGAGYWGYQSSRAEVEQPPQAPPTVPVTTCDVQQSVTAPGKLVNTRHVTVQMPLAGQLGTVNVRAGDHVTQGEVLASLADREKYAADVTAAQLAVLQARQDLQDLQDNAATAAAQAQVAMVAAQIAQEQAQKKRDRMNYPHTTDPLVIEKAHTDYLLAKLDYKDALRKYNDVAKKNLTNLQRAQALNRLVAAQQKMDDALGLWNWYMLGYTPDDIAQADAALSLANAQLADAQASYDLLRAGPDSLQLDLANAKMQDAEANLAEAQKNLENVDIRAPFDGVVLDVPASSDDYLAAGAALLVLDDPQALEVQATVTEEDLPNVVVGQPAEVFFDALPDLQATGALSRIVPQRVAGSDRPLYTVYLSLDQAPEQLVAGMTADASIITAQANGVLCLPRAVVRASSGDTTSVKVWVGDHTETRQIQVGLRGDANIEIRSGLSQGELVVAQ